MKTLRQRLRSGEVVLGQMVLELFTSGIGTMLAAAGMEFVIYDMEHGRCDIGLLAEMVASCRGSQIVPMARVPDLHFQPLSRVLDVGAKGVMVPRFETRAQAEEGGAQSPPLRLQRPLRQQPQHRRIRPVLPGRAEAHQRPAVVQRRLPGGQEDRHHHRGGHAAHRL